MRRNTVKTKNLFDQDYLLELVEEIDIIEFISKYLPLVKSGQNYKTKCPFHTENTPSFVVSPSKRIYHCYGCGGGGNVIKFLMAYEKMPFYEAVLFLSEKLGKTPPNTTNTKKYIEYRERQQELIKANNLALQTWKNNLTNSLVAQEYLKIREITEDSIDLFQIGYADDSWTQITTLLEKEIPSLSSSGLTSTSNGKTFDKFKNRIITPVFDVRDRLVGFSGRLLGKEKGAKYLNTPDTELYVKGKHLFGLNISKTHIVKKGFAILTEGNFDVISLHQNGVTNVVAALGTAFTEDQAKLLRRFTDKVVLCYDSDDAGVKAAEASIKVLLKESFLIKVMELPDNFDPDSYVRTYGKGEFNNLRSASLEWFKYLLKKKKQQYDINNPTEKVKLISEIQDVVKCANTELEKREYFSLCMADLKVDKDIVKEYWSKISSTHSIPNTGTPIDTTLTESKFLQLLIHSEDRKTAVDQIKHYITTPSIKKISLVLSATTGKFNYSVVESLLEQNERTLLRKLVLDAEPLIQTLKDVDRELANCIISIKHDFLLSQIDKLGGEIRNLMVNKGVDWDEEIQELFTKQVELAKEISSL